MPEPVRGPVLVAFEYLFDSAADELERLGDEVAVRFLRFLDKIAGGHEDYRRLRPFAEYEGVPLFRAEIEDNVMIYAVEEDEAGDLKVTVMLCARRSAGDFRRKALERARVWFTGAGGA